MKFLFTFLVVLFSLQVMAAENCKISVSPIASTALKASLVKKGYQLVGTDSATYDLFFDEFKTQSIFEEGGYRALHAEDQIIAVSGSVIMKITKRLTNGKNDLQFAFKKSGSLSTCQGTCFAGLDKATTQLFEKLAQDQKFVAVLPTCRQLN
jgi:hypothetical protein